MANPAWRAALTQATSFNVHGDLTYAENPPPGENQADFMLRLDPVAKTMVIGNREWLEVVSVQTDDGIKFQVPPPGVNTRGGISNGVHFDRFVVTVADDRLTGTGTGYVAVAVDDVVSQHAVEAQWTGNIDTVGPSLFRDPSGPDPLSPIDISLNEPLPGSATAKLVSGTETIDLTPITFGTGLVHSFERDAERALRYGTTYQVVVNPWVDLAGNPGGPAPDVITPAPPELVAEDGFESVADRAGGALVAGSDVVPPISGNRSLVLQGGQGPVPSLRSASSTRVTMRLAVAPGDRVVRFSLRAIYHQQTHTQWPAGYFRVAIPGGAIVRVVLPDVSAASAGPFRSGDETYWLGDTVSVAFALPADTGNEAIFDAGVPSGQLAGIPIRDDAFQIDDLRVE